MTDWWTGELSCSNQGESKHRHLRWERGQEYSWSLWYKTRVVRYQSILSTYVSIRIFCEVVESEGDDMNQFYLFSNIIWLKSNNYSSNSNAMTYDCLIWFQTHKISAQAIMAIMIKWTLHLTLKLKVVRQSEHALIVPVYETTLNSRQDLLNIWPGCLWDSLVAAAA